MTQQILKSRSDADDNLNFSGSSNGKEERMDQRAGASVLYLRPGKPFDLPACSFSYSYDICSAR